MKKMAKCPSCMFKVDIGEKPRFGQRIKCPDCEAVLEIIQINPPILDWLFDEDKDYSYDANFYFDEMSFERHI